LVAVQIIARSPAVVKTAAVLRPVHGVQHRLIKEISGNQLETGYLSNAYGAVFLHVGRQCVQGSRPSSEDRLFFTTEKSACSMSKLCGLGQCKCSDEPSVGESEACERPGGFLASTCSRMRLIRGARFCFFLQRYNLFVIDHTLGGYDKHCSGGNICPRRK
jgi:hypothetical protein